MKQIGICKLCDKNKLLKHSHIISKALFSDVFDKQHRVKSITADNKNKSRIMQDGFKEYLLCSDCEQKFGIWENILKKTLIDIEKEKSKILNISKLDNGDIFTKGIEYNPFKKSLLSFIWRISISSIDEFKDYNLNSLEIEFKNILLNDLIVNDWEYPIIMTKTTLQNNIPSRFNMFQNKIIKLNQYNLAEFVIYGFFFNIILSKEKLTNDQMKLILRENGNFQIRVKEIKDIGIDDNILKRLDDDDIKYFYDL